MVQPRGVPTGIIEYGLSVTSGRAVLHSSVHVAPVSTKKGISLPLTVNSVNGSVLESIV